MELTGIKNILFDLGGVLLNLSFERTKKAFEELGVEDFNDYYNKGRQTGLFDLFETGQIDEAMFCDQLKRLAGIDGSKDDIIEAWNSMLLDFPKVRKELLLKLKEEFNITLLSNTNETHIRAFNQRLTRDIGEVTLDPMFHQVYFSNEIGFRKPDVETFKWVLNQRGYRAEETLFLDDSIQHIRGAEACDINAFHVQDIPVEELFYDFLT